MTKNGADENRPGQKSGGQNNPVAMNHLLLGKKPLVTSKPRRGPNPGAIPSPKNKQRVPPPSAQHQQQAPAVNHRAQQAQSGLKNGGNNNSGTETTVSTSGAATHYTCPQPEVVPPDELKKRKGSKHHRKKSHSSDAIDETIEDSKSKRRPDTPSSSTEVACDENEDSDDAKSDADIAEISNDSSVVDVPKLKVETIPSVETSSGAIRVSKSSHAIGGVAEPETRILSVEKAAMSETDLVKVSSDGNNDDRNKLFIEELLKEFDSPSIADHTRPGDQTEQAEVEGENGPPPTERNDRALQIIKENSEILERILSKKTTSLNDKDMDQLRNMNTNDGLEEEDIVPPQQQQQQQPQQPPPPQSRTIPMQQQQHKRKVSHSTSSTGSTNSSANSSNPTKTNNITLQSNPATKPITFNPFPGRTNRKPKEVGRKLGLYK